MNKKLGTALAMNWLQGLSPVIGDMIMKFETLMLRGLFIACTAVCALIMGAMLNATPGSMKLPAHNAVASISTVLLAAPQSCALPPDGVMCPRLGG